MSSVTKVLTPLKTFFHTDFGIALLITIVWKVVLTMIGFAIDAQDGAVSLFDHTIRWDAGWYMIIIQDWYTTNISSSVFYPLFPALVGVVHFIGVGNIDYPVAGQIINTLAVWFALTALLKLGRLFIGGKGRLWLIALFLSAPTAFFLHAFYSEAVFATLSFWAYYFALKRRWLGVGILLTLLSASRLPSVLIIALTILEFMRAYDWKLRKIWNKNLLYFLLAPLGFVGYGLYLTFTQHDFLGMFHAYQTATDWTYQIFNPNILETIGRAGYQVIRVLGDLRPLDNDFVINNLFPLLALLVLGVSSIYLLRIKSRRFIPLGIVGLLSVVMFTLNSNVVSVHRYVLGSLVILVALGLYIKSLKHKKLALIGCCVVGCIGQLYLYSLFVQTIFAG